MAKFPIGTKVSNLRYKTIGVVTGDPQKHASGRVMYKVTVNEKDTLWFENDMVAMENSNDPYEKLQKGMVGLYDDFKRINTEFKINNLNNNTISSLKASKTIFQPYQFKPLLKFLNSDNRRILVADEVGLGKTIEAGHIMLEMQARRELNNVLIVCPKSLQVKWRDELKEKFNLPFKIYDKAESLYEDFKNQPSVKAIVNYEKIRLPKDRSERERANKPAIEQIVGLFEDNQCELNFVLCDEAHKLRNKETQTYKGAEEIFEHAKAAVLLTATPIMISEENLYNLLHLLDKQTYPNYAEFENRLAMNKPFIQALSQVSNQVPFRKIKEDLTGARFTFRFSSGKDQQVVYEHAFTVEDYYAADPLYQEIIGVLESGNDTLETRTRLQFILSSMGVINKIFSRTRKKEVTVDGTQAKRDPKTYKVKLNDEERYQFDSVIDCYTNDNSYEDEYGEEVLTQGASLGLVQKKRQISSSVYGYLNTAGDLERGIDRYGMLKDAKFDKLQEIINEVVNKNHKKLIVFSLFRKTLQYLSIRLRAAGIKSLMIHGGIDDRDEVVSQFKTQKDVKILLSSEVGSEGLDMQFCDALVNYDLPWNPMVVEQRIGRIDRFGQKSEVVHIYNLIVEDSIQEDIYDRLLQRIGIFQDCIGDLEAIFDAEIQDNPNFKTIREWHSSLEKELYYTHLTKEEKDKKLQDVAMAIEHQKRDLEKISEGLTNTLTNDIYFQNEIERIQKNHQYVTGAELKTYLESLIRRHLQQCDLKEVEENVYAFEIPASEPKTLSRFIEGNMPLESEEKCAECRKFKSRIIDKQSFKLTFDQKTAYEKGTLQYVNAYHPLIVCAVNFFKSLQQEKHNAFCLTIPQACISDIKLERGRYFLAVFIMQIIKEQYGKKQIIKNQVPILYDAAAQQIVQDVEIAERILGEAQLHAAPARPMEEITEGFIDNLKGSFMIRIGEIEDEKIKERERELESSKRQQLSLKSEYYEKEISQLQDQVDRMEQILYDPYEMDETKRRMEQILPARRGALRKKIDEKERVMQEIDSCRIYLGENELSSISLIEIC